MTGGCFQRSTTSQRRQWQSEGLIADKEGWDVDGDYQSGVARVICVPTHAQGTRLANSIRLPSRRHSTDAEKIFRLMRSLEYEETYDMRRNVNELWFKMLCRPV